LVSDRFAVDGLHRGAGQVDDHIDRAAVRPDRTSCGRWSSTLPKSPLMRSNGSPIVAASGLYVNRVIFTQRSKASLPPDWHHTCRRHRDMVRIVEVRVEHLESQDLGAAS
jgi:hypothetical protein